MRISIRPFIVGLGTLFVTAAAFAVAPLSQYGQIQNVQNYSSNPFWSPNAPYNQRVMPTPVYATGPDVSTQNCQTIVASLVAAQCAAQNNCNGMGVSDIRPAIMLGLSRLPGHNFATACSGYIDQAFDTYVNQFANTVQPTAFPASTGPAAQQQNSNFEIKNPYAPKIPDWAIEKKEREMELQQLQSQNGAGTERIAKADFPKTINDVSFLDRMDNLAAGYAPYKDANVYNGIKVETQQDAMARRQEMAKARQELDYMQLSRDEYCAKYPGDSRRCDTPESDQQQNNANRERVIEMLAQLLKSAQQ